MTNSTADGSDGYAMVGEDRWALAANGLTVIRFIGAPLLAMLIAARNPWWVSFWFALFLGLTDFLDGRLARRSRPTKLGAFLDPLADKLVVLLSGWVLVAVGRFSWVPIAIIMAREVAITVYRSYWARRGVSIPARTTAKYKTLVQGLAILAALCPALDGAPIVADILLWFAVLFTVVTAVQYALDGRNLGRSTSSR